MRKIRLLLIPIMILCLSGCAKVVSETYEVVPVRVMDAYYNPGTAGRVGTSPSGGVEVLYDGKTWDLYGIAYFDRFCGMIGKEAWAILRTRVLSNDKTRLRIIDLYETQEQAGFILEKAYKAVFDPVEEDG